MKTDAELLREAKRLIWKKKNWCTMTYALNKEGIAVSPHDEGAERFCALGAIMRVTRRQGSSFQNGHLYKFFHPSASPHTRCLIQNINDYQGHAAVMRLFNKAIKAAEAKAP